LDALPGRCDQAAAKADAHAPAGCGQGGLALTAGTGLELALRKPAAEINVPYGGATAVPIRPSHQPLLSSVMGQVAYLWGANDSVPPANRLDPEKCGKSGVFV
jgi:hypothetical protein